MSKFLDSGFLILRILARRAGRGVDAVGNPHRAQISRFEPFELVLRQEQTHVFSGYLFVEHYNGTQGSYKEFTWLAETRRGWLKMAYIPYTIPQVTLT